MAKKNPPRKGEGISGPPPKANKKQSKDNKKGKKEKQPKVQQLPGLTKPQNKSIDLRQRADIDISKFANQQLPEVFESYEQPFNWEALPQQSQRVNWEALPEAPGTQDYTGWVQQQMQGYNQAFDERMNPVFSEQLENFEQTMANRGIPMGSELYNREKSRLEQSQSQQRSQAYAENQGQAVNAATSLFGAGLQGRQQGVGEALSQFDLGNTIYDRQLQQQMQRRNLPLSEFNALYSATSPMALQNLQYAQQRGLQSQEFQNQMRLMKATPRGGGGGGGGNPPIWAQYGYSSPAEYDAYKVNQARDQAMWEFQNDPRYRQPSRPSTGSQIAGTIGTIGGIIGGSYVGGLI
jgi:hypothetical protein